MLKEIHEQPTTLKHVMEGRLDHGKATARLAGIHRTAREIRNWKSIIFTGCGSSLNAALVGEYIIESLARIPVECEYASEFRYRNRPLAANQAVFAVTQSGETGDTLAALREAKLKGTSIFGICNNPISTLGRESEGGIDMRAGDEYGIVATKTFTAQLTILAMLGLELGRMIGLTHAQGSEILTALEKLPALVAETLELDAQIRLIAQTYKSAGNFLFFGRQANFPIALDGALKLEEMTHIPASGHPSAELEHGVAAMINKTTASVFIALQDEVFDKNLGNISRVKDLTAPVIAIGTKGDTSLDGVCDDVVLIPQAPDYLQPVLAAIPLQLLAYHLATFLGSDIDKPRNPINNTTAKSTNVMSATSGNRPVVQEDLS
jgi:glucosamine--fructose-6-phosphate aminotransferase (isomerizing)